MKNDISKIGFVVQIFLVFVCACVAFNSSCDNAYRSTNNVEIIRINDSIVRINGIVVHVRDTAALFNHIKR